MRKLLITAAAAGAFAVAGSSAAFADHPLVDPGGANCHGQVISYLNHVYGTVGINGIGNLAKATGLSVKEIQAIVDEYCNA